MGTVLLPVYNVAVKYRLTATAVLAAAAIALALWLARPAPIIATDQEQPRLNQAAPTPHGTSVVVQSLVAGHDGLSSVELLAVAGPAQPSSAILTVQLLNSAGEVVAEQDFAGVKHNAPLRLDLPPQPHSKGHSYLLKLSGSPDNIATAWAYSLDGYLAGSLTIDGQPQAGDLYFKSSYTYLWPAALGDAAASLWGLAAVAVPMWLLLFAPGALLLGVLGPVGGLARPPGARWGLSLGLSVSLLALAWLWAGVAGWRWSPAGLWVVYGALGLAAIGRALLGWRRRGWPRVRLETLALAAIVLASVLVRLLAVRDLALPAWVDSSHHLLIARLLELGGQIPASYQPFLPVDVFYYHFAFHVLLVSLHWLTAMPLADAALLLGQVLNGLIPLAAYALAWGLTGRRRAALAAALVAGLVSYFPGYFVNWGRYTQLTGLLVLGPAAAVLWRALRPAGPGRWSSFRLAVLAAVLAAGVLLAHYRVLAFYAAFALVAFLAHARQRRAWVALALAGAGGALLSLPWLGRLAAQAILPVA
ncbi:MAG: hypothetical protein ABI847_15495, partial [Anaerolineales bacterium]